jgi:hypothetical protein
LAALLLAAGLGIGAWIWLGPGPSQIKEEAATDGAFAF